MNTFIQQNKKLFKFYYYALRLAGWILLTLGICCLPIGIIMIRNLGPKGYAISAMNMPLRSLHFILFGLLGLGIAQLIQYLYKSGDKPGFILRHGSKFLHIYVVLILIIMVTRNVATIQYLTHNDIKHEQILYISTTVTSAVLFAAKALILIGVAQFLKRLLPMIEESKTLV